jgi:hypothetical protein
MKEVFAKGTVRGKEGEVINMTMAPSISPGIKTRSPIMPIMGVAKPSTMVRLSKEPGGNPEPVAEKKGTYIIMPMPLYRPMVRENMTVPIRVIIMGVRYHSIWYCHGSGPKVSIWAAGSLAIKDPLKLPSNSKGALWPEGGWTFLYIVFIESSLFPQYHLWDPLFHAGQTQNTVTKEATVMETDTHFNPSIVFFMGLTSRRGMNF